jgi:hypothetical protein
VSMDEPRVAEPEAGPTEVAGDEAALFEPLNLLAELRFIAATPPTTERPETLPLASIVVKPGLFQPRGEDERHISELVRGHRQVEQSLDGRTTVFLTGEEIRLRLLRSRSHTRPQRLARARPDEDPQKRIQDREDERDSRLDREPTGTSARAGLT